MSKNETILKKITDQAILPLYFNADETVSIEVLKALYTAGMIWIPGCMTPSEIIRAENLGAKMIKLFPGDILGPKFMAGIKSLFPNLIFMPTGGVSLDKDNVQAWFSAGVSAVGMGSKLVSKQLLQDKNYTEIHELAKKAIALVNEVKG